MPKFYVIEEREYTEYASEEDAINEAEAMGANGILVKAIADIGWIRREPTFRVTKLED